jgi:hypothetical protein
LAGVDWNGNGKYDTVNVGIDIAVQESESEEDNERQKGSKHGGGFNG